MRLHVNLNDLFIPPAWHKPGTYTGTITIYFDPRQAGVVSPAVNLARPMDPPKGLKEGIGIPLAEVRDTISTPLLRAWLETEMDALWSLADCFTGADCHMNENKSGWDAAALERVLAPLKERLDAAVKSGVFNPGESE